MTPLISYRCGGEPDHRSGEGLRAGGEGQAGLKTELSRAFPHIAPIPPVGAGDEIQMWPCPLAFQPLSPWQVLTAVSGMGAARLGGGKRDQVRHLGGGGSCPKGG